VPSSISLRTAIPGPKSLALAERRRNAVPASVSMITPVFVARAHGAILEDVDGNHLLDFAGGIGCTNAGHAPATVTAAIAQQSAEFLHTCFMVAPYEGYVAVAERLNALAPGTSEKRTFLANSGAEVVENAVKLARAYTRREAILCFDDAYHGRTYMAMALTSKVVPYKDGFAPFPGEVYRAPYPYCYRAGCTATEHHCVMKSETDLERSLFAAIDAEHVAAIILEPVLGEGGFIVPPPEFLPSLRRICNRHGIVLIVDEVQTGFGRTGKLFASNHANVEPDLLLTAKSLASGMPLAAITGKAEIMNHPVTGALGGTFGGNPLSCAAALATLDLFADARLCDRAIALGNRFHQRALEWQKIFPFIGDVRGLGAMQAIELVEDRETKVPATALTKTIAREAHERGLILVTAGTYGNVLRLLIPLVATDEEMDEGLAVLEASMHTAISTAALASTH
jgi:4-aminobutyrate aminotransferase/(S)-3-amino-2-methylpropionate transaminase